MKNLTLSHPEANEIDTMYQKIQTMSLSELKSVVRESEDEEIKHYATLRFLELKDSPQTESDFKKQYYRMSFLFKESLSETFTTPDIEAVADKLTHGNDALKNSVRKFASIISKLRSKVDSLSEEKMLLQESIKHHHTLLNLLEDQSQK